MLKNHPVVIGSTVLAVIIFLVGAIMIVYSPVQVTHVATSEDGDRQIAQEPQQEPIQVAVTVSPQQLTQMPEPSGKTVEVPPSWKGIFEDEPQVLAADQTSEQIALEVEETDRKIREQLTLDGVLDTNGEIVLPKP